MKKNILIGASALLLLASLMILIWGICNRRTLFQEPYDDGVTQVDLNTIYLGDSGVEVNFAEVLLGKQNETRKLIVSTQEASISIELTDSLINKLDFDFLKKTQKISYTGKGYFVVDLDNLNAGSIVQDNENKIVTIRIRHAYLQALEIDPNKIVVGDVKETLLARGDIKLSMADYKEIENEIVKRMRAKFDTSEQGQIADATALRMVKEIYEPVIKAIDDDFSVVVEFRE